MTNMAPWAKLTSLTIVIGTLSACSAASNPLGSSVLRIQDQAVSLDSSASLADQPSLSTAASVPVPASGSDDTVRAEHANLYAKGFKDGYADCARASKENSERKEYLKLHAKYGDRFTTPGAKDLPVAKQ